LYIDLENIQRKMDQGFAALTKELSEIKKSYETMEQARQKSEAAAAVAAANSQLARTGSLRRSDSSQQLRSVVQKAMTRNQSSPSISISMTPASTSASTSASTLTPSTPQSKVSAPELKVHWEEVQTLRQDLSIIRQLYTEFQSETKITLANAAAYASQAKKQATEAPTASRLHIETGKVKLDQKSEDLTNRIENLQDIVEDMKTNVTQRRGRPSETALAFAEKECSEISRGIDELSDYIQTLRPAWKKTWETELQTIVKEQMFLKEQEALLEDLKEDRGSLLQTLGNIVKVIELQSQSGDGVGKGREFVFQPAVDENFEGLKTVLEEVKMVEPDSEKRLKAMAQMEKLRHIELSNRIDEFEHELTTFVGKGKLKKTGGALEAERMRQQRDSENLKAMFAKAKQDEETPSQQ
jgi:hypothetical protein